MRATIKAGYNEKPCHLVFEKNGVHTTYVILRIEQEGVTVGKNETLSYVSLEELVVLRDTINEMLKTVLGL